MISEEKTTKQRLEDQLINSARENRLPHAMLFTSPEGGGAMPMALHLAKYILCSNKTADGKFCGNCNSCNSVDRLTHPDLFLTFPVYNKDSNKKYTSNDFISEFREFIISNPYAPATAWIQSLTTENKQGNISAEECKSISSRMMLKSILGGAKILIIWYAEYLGKEGNRLLKLIEEPPKNTYILFVAENTDKILGTILSRTQQFKVPPIPSHEVESFLSEKGIEAERALELAKQSQGNLFKAFQLAKNTNTNYFNHLRNWFNALYTNNGVLLSNWLRDSQAMSKEELKNFFHYAEHIFEQALRVQHLPENFWSLTAVETRLVRGLLNKGLEASNCEKAGEICARAAYHLERNVFKKVLLHAISFEIQEALVE